MEKCPSCNSPVNIDSKFCNECGYKMIEAAGNDTDISYSKRTYKLRSPMLESELLYGGSKEKKYGFTTILSYGFWLSTFIFVIFGIKTIYDSYTVDLFAGIVTSFLYFTLALFCSILPAVFNLLVDIDEHLVILAKEAKKEK